MIFVYKNSVITIAAVTSNDDIGGCFVEYLAVLLRVGDKDPESKSKGRFEWMTLDLGLGVTYI